MSVSTFCCRGIRQNVVAWTSSVNTTNGRPYAVVAMIAQSGALSLFSIRSTMLLSVSAMVRLRRQGSSIASESSRYTPSLSTLDLGDSSSNPSQIGVCFVTGWLFAVGNTTARSRCGMYDVAERSYYTLRCIQWRLWWCCTLRLVQSCNSMCIRNNLSRLGAMWYLM